MMNIAPLLPQIFRNPVELASLTAVFFSHSTLGCSAGGGSSCNGVVRYCPARHGGEFGASLGDVGD